MAFAKVIKTVRFFGFQTDDFDAAIARINVLPAEVLEGSQVNPSANHRETWLRDLDGYVIVVAGQRGDLGLRSLL